MSVTDVDIGIVLLHKVSTCLVAAAQRLQGMRTGMGQSLGFPAPRGPKWEYLGTPYSIQDRNK
jgi:hypothetical protein